MKTQNLICRLCLKICDSFKALEGNLKYFLDKLLPKVNLAAIQKPVICTNCATMLKKCFDFKLTCTNAHYNIIPFVINKDAVKMDPVDVPLSRNENGTGVPKDICTFCMSSVKSFSTTSLYVEEGDLTLKQMIEQFLPELDLSAIKKSVTCTPCRESLEMCFHFITNCLMVEEKIKKHCETLDISSKDQVELSSLLQFPIIDVTTGEVDVVKMEQFCEDEDNADDRQMGKANDIFKLEQVFCDDSENAEFKNKSYMDITDPNNEEQFTLKNMLVWKEGSNNFDVIKIEDTICGESEIKEEELVEMEDQKFIPIEEIEMKTSESDICRFEDDVDLPQPHLLAQKDSSKLTIHKCDFCPFQTILEIDLKLHLLMHKDPLEVTMYKCDSCPFRSRYKGNLKDHSLMHKKPSEVTLYKCDSCSYQTRAKNYLQKHLLKHKDPSEVTMYKCDSCLHQTKYKNNFRKHLLKHKDPSEIIMYKCFCCSYQTRCKSNINIHLLMHKDPSEVIMYKCTHCSFQTKHKGSYNRHKLIHKGSSEVIKYKCDSCSYRTENKYHLKIHLLTHKSLPSVTIFKCDSCSFQTKHEDTLKNHLLDHKDPSDVAMYKCDSCSFQTRRRDNLKRHIVAHKDPSEMTMYKCDSCLFQTRHKNSLKRHLLKHIS